MYVLVLRPYRKDNIYFRTIEEREKINILLLRNRKEDEAETWHTCTGHCPLQKLCFYSSRMRTLVAITTYSFNRLIMGKVEIGNFYCLIGDNRILFLQKCLLNSSPLL